MKLRMPLKCTLVLSLPVWRSRPWSGWQGESAADVIGPAEFDTGEFDITELGFSFTPQGATQTDLVYLIGDDIIGQGGQRFGVH